MKTILALLVLFIISVGLAVLGLRAPASEADPLPVSVASAPDGAPEGSLPRRIAITFDDLPGTALAQSPCEPEVIRERNRRLLAHLDRFAIPAAGLVNEGHGCGPGPVLEEILTAWVEAGHDLGNHTYSHPNLDTTSLAAYIADIERGETVTRRVLEAHDKTLRYFRHPQLHAGPDSAKWHGLRAYLDGRGYVIAPVTIDNQEWIFEAVYRRAKARGDSAMMQRVSEAYVPFMEEVVAFFEDWSRTVVGYEPPQVLLLHDNEINADHFDRVAVMLQRRSYRFVSLDEALADPAYALPDGYIGPHGPSWIHRWALGQGMTIPAREPREPAWLAERFQTYR